MIAALLVAGVLFLLRHPLLHVQFDGALWSGLVDKWHLSALRLLDFSSFAILFAVSRSWLARWLTISPLVSLRKASLEVFCAHLLFCFAAFSLCRGRKRFARMDTVGFDRNQSYWSLYGSQTIRAHAL